MKKIIALVAALAILSVCSVAVIAKEVNKNNDTLTYEENVIYGDSSAALGLSVKSLSHLENHLTWDSVYDIGGEAETKFDFHYHKYYSRGSFNSASIVVSSGLHMGFDTDKPASEQVGIAKAYKELYDSLKQGERGSKVIRLADYYDYYPLDLNVNLPGIHLHEHSFYTPDSPYYTSADEEKYKQYKAFLDYFKIPMLDSEYIEISISKDYNGFGFGSGANNLDKSADTYSVSSRSTKTDKACYFVLNNKTERNKTMDFSLISGEYGVYSFPYSSTKIKTVELATVYPLDESTDVTFISVNSKQDKLLLTVVENDITYLEVIDIATMTQIQKIKILEGKHTVVYPYESFTVYTFENHVAVIEEKDGEFRLCFITELYPYEEKPFYFNRNSGASMAFDGERLAVCDNSWFDQSSYDMCGFYVAVYTAEGLQYYGTYKTSLDVTNNTDISYNLRCHPLKTPEIEWK